MEKRKHRGAGSRGGRGNAGSGKRADTNKPKYFGRPRKAKQGFVSKSRTIEVAMNISELNRKIHHYVKKGKAQQNGEEYVIDLKTLKINKLLGKGKTSKKYNIIVEKATESAIKTIRDCRRKSSNKR